MNKAYEKSDYTFGVIVPMMTEWRQFLEFFSGKGQQKGSYTELNIDLQDRSVRILAVACSQQGNWESADATASLLDKYDAPSIDCFFLVGIAGSLRKTVGLLDAVISRDVFYYLERGKVIEERAKCSERCILPRLEFAGSRKQARGLPSSLFQLDPDYSTPSGDSWPLDKYQLASRFDIDPKTIDKFFVTPKVVEHTEYAMASGELVCTSRWLSSQIVGVDRKLGAVEMEAYGFARTLWRAGHERFVVIRGISDLADPGKGRIGRQTDSSGEEKVQKAAAWVSFEILMRLINRWVLITSDGSKFRETDNEEKISDLTDLGSAGDSDVNEIDVIGPDFEGKIQLERKHIGDDIGLELGDSLLGKVDVSLLRRALEEAVRRGADNDISQLLAASSDGAVLLKNGWIWLWPERTCAEFQRLLDLLEPGRRISELSTFVAENLHDVSKKDRLRMTARLSSVTRKLAKHHSRYKSTDKET